MIRFAQIAIAAGALVASMPAQAAEFVINTAAGTSNGSAISNGTSYNNINYKVTSTDGKSTVNVKASAWSRDLDGNFAAAKMVSWGSDGMGIYQTNESTGGNLHQIDNVNGWEFLVLQFDQAVSLQSAVLKSFQLAGRDYVDSDAFVARWTTSYAAGMSASTMAGIEKAMNSETWFNSNSDDYSKSVSGSAANGTLTQTQTQTYNLSPSKEGNVWIIGGSFNGPDWRNDAFKLNQIKVISAVPEPATWMTMILGFGLVGATVRRRRGSAKSALA